MKGAVVVFTCLIVIIRGAPRISGGDAAPITAYPFAAGLLSNGGTGATYVLTCGGTILSDRAILSAASCFYTNGTTLHDVTWWRARIGSAQTSTGGSLHYINRITPHPDYTPAGAADLAILRPTIPFTLQASFVQSARIAGGAYNLEVNAPVWAIGWGAATDGAEPSQQLQAVQFWVVDRTTCANRYSTLGFTVTDAMVCAGWLDVGIRGQCQGDNGGPLVQDDIVVAVFSWSERCGDGWYPNINTQIAPYTRWIVATATEA